MKAEEIKQLFESFEAIAIEYEGVECWSARELYPVLGYARWDRFKEAINRAKESCVNAGESITDHFSNVGKMVLLGSGAERQIDDILLTRYACYLIAQTATHGSQRLLLRKTILRRNSCYVKDYCYL